MILHFGQILFTDALTFIYTLLMPQKLTGKSPVSIFAAPVYLPPSPT
jgi:hypothetical protein